MQSSVAGVVNGTSAEEHRSSSLSFTEHAKLLSTRGIQDKVFFCSGTSTRSDILYFQDTIHLSRLIHYILLLVVVSGYVERHRTGLAISKSSCATGLFPPTFDTIPFNLRHNSGSQDHSFQSLTQIWTKSD